MGLPLEVNGATREVPARPDTPLLWALRDLGLTAAKYGCGADRCGSCRVLVGDAPVASCQVALGDVTAPVSTLEALVDTPEGERVVTALAGINAGQCAYCLPGIAVTLIHLARRTSPPDEEELLRALDAHLCRCGSQPRILRAARQALGGGRQ